MYTASYVSRPRLQVLDGLAWIDRLPNLRATARRILDVIFRGVDSLTWTTSPRFPLTIERIAERAGCSTATVERTIPRLVALGCVVRIRGDLVRLDDGSFRRRPNTYRVCLPDDVIERMRAKVGRVRDIEEDFRRAAEEPPPEDVAPPSQAPEVAPTEPPPMRPLPKPEDVVKAQRRAAEGTSEWEVEHAEDVLRHGYIELRRPKAGPTVNERCAVAWALLTAHTLDVVRAAYSFGLYKHDEVGICVRDWCIKVVREGRDVSPKLRSFGRSLLRFFQAKATHRGAEAGVKRQEELARRFGNARGPDENRRARATLATLPMLPVSHGF